MKKLYSYKNMKARALFSIILVLLGMAWAPLARGQSYCTPGATNVNSYGCGVQSISMGSINNSTGQPNFNQYYYDFSSQYFASFAAGATANFSIQVGSGNASKIGIYVDWDNDKTFSASEQVVLTGTVNSNATYNGNFSIPGGQATGLYRMRVVVDISFATIDPCQLQYTGEIEDYSIAVTSPTLDVAAVSATQLLNIGNNTINLQAVNLTSTTTITSLDFGYKLNNNTPVTESVSSLSLQPGTAMSRNFTNALNISTPGIYTLKTWVRNPNGNGSGIAGNDTITRIIQACYPLNGTYTIDPNGSGGSNFTDFASAVADLGTCGISGPVTFNVASGTFSEQVSIPFISGASATNTIKFIGAGKNSTLLAFGGQTDSKRYTLNFNGCSYVHFSDMTIRSTNGSYGYTVHFTGSTVSDNSIRRVNVECAGGGVSTTNTNFSPVVFSGSSSSYSTNILAFNNVVDSCELTGGYFSLTFYGITSTNANYGNVFSNNVMSGAYYYGIYANYLSEIKIIKNVITTRSTGTTTTAGSGMYIVNSNNSYPYLHEIRGNTVSGVGQYGIYTSSVNGSVGSRGIMANNMVGGNFRNTSSNYGIYMNYSTWWNIYFNTVGLSNNVSGDAIAMYILGNTNQFNVDVRNNMLQVNANAGNPLAFYGSSNSVFSDLDYNNYWVSPASSLIFVGQNLGASNFVGVNSQNANSKNIESPFQSSTNLRYSNGCITGIPVSQIIKDIDGDNRTSTPNIGCDEFINTSTNDIGILKIKTPAAPVVLGLTDVVVTLKNFGTNTITSAQISYALNGGTPVNLSWTGTLLPCGEVDVTFTGTNQLTIGPGVNNIVASSSLPGGNADNFPGNDATQITVCPAMSGTFTIDPSGTGSSNFTSFTAAFDALSCSGLDGAVTFNVAAGTYAEQVALRNINGVSAQNTITIDGGNGNASSRILVNGNTQNTTRHTLLLENMQFVTLKNLTIRGTSTSYAWPLHIMGNSTANITVESCVVELSGGAASSTGSNLSPLVVNGDASNLSSNASFNNILINNCTISGGYYGLTMYGNSSNCTDIVITNNNMTNTYYYGVFLYYLSDIEFDNNNLVMRGNNTNSQGFYFYNFNLGAGREFKITNNKSSDVGRYGMYIAYSNANSSKRGLLSNNMIAGGFTSTSARGIYMQSSSYWDVWHNSVNVDCQQTSTTSAAFYISSCSYMDVRNNVFALTYPFQNSGSIYPVYMNSGTALVCDYNNFYKPGNTNNFVRVNSSIYNANNFKGGGGFNTNSYFSYPGFNSARDLHINNGCLVGPSITAVPTDIDGDLRSSTTSIGADEGVALDASVDGLIDPAGTNISGTQDVSFRVKNTGRTVITSFTAGYLVNGSSLTTQNWSGSLQPCDSVLITFTAGQAATIPNSGLVSVAGFVSLVNGGADNKPSNDTAANSYCNGPLAGTYTVNSTSAAANNFGSLTSLMDVLYSCGMSGNVEIQFAAEKFTGQMNLDPNQITGLASNSLTISGVDSASSIISYNGGGYTVRLNGADNIVFNNIGIENTGTSSAFGVHLTNGADNNTFSHVMITVPAISNTSIIAYGVMGSSYSQTGSNWGNGNLLEYSKVSGGYIAVNHYGSGNSSLLSQGNKVHHCVITDATYYQGYNYFQEGAEFKDNWMVSGSGNTGVLYFSYSPTSQIERNTLLGGQSYGLYMNQVNPNTSFGFSNVVNNMIGGIYGTGTSYGIYNINTYNTRFYHNTVFMPSTGNSHRAFHNSSGNTNELVNNIFISESPNGHAIYLNTNNAFNKIDYNNYRSSSTILAYTWGTNYADLASLQGSNATFNQNSVSIAPEFISASIVEPNLHIKPTWQAPYGDNTLGVNVDIDNDSRCVSAKTIGADESGYIDPVSVQFTAPDTVFVNSPFTAINADVPGSLKAYEWDFNNDGSIEFTTLNATYTFNSAGVKSIKLISRTCNGADSMIRQVVVTTPSAAPVADFISDKYSAAPFDEVTLQDLSTNGPIGWTWEITPDPNGLIFYDPFEQNPVIFFGEPGVYDVCLTSQNALGSSTKKCKTGYITIRDVNSLCIGNQSSSATSGEIYDSGGPTAPYGTNENCTFLIEPCASSVNLKFSEFNLANSAHVLRVYDGKDATGTLLGSFSNTSGLPGGTNGLTASSGSMYLTWQTSITGTASGFAATWTSVADTNNLLIADFNVRDSAYVQELVNFNNTSFGSGLQYSWDLDGDGIEDDQSLNASFLYTVNGTYYPKLSVSDACGNSDSHTDTIIVTTPTNAPNVDFKADARVVTVTDTVRFTDLSTNGPITWNYTFNPSTVTVVGGSARNPIVLFDDTGYYEVTLATSNAAGSSNATKTAYVHVIEICTGGVSTLVPDLGINRVKLNQLDNTSSSGVVGYTSYFNNPGVTAAQLDAGGTYVLTVSRNSTLNRMNRKAWIDYNGDGDFDDAGELIGSEAAATTPSWNLTFTVPTSGIRTATRMRIGTAFADSTNEPCGTNFYGEVEEYRVVINDDITPPVITRTGPSPVFIELGQSYSDLGATAEDAVDGNLDNSIISTDNLNINVAGTYYYYYNVMDAAGNQAEEVTRTIIVRPDNTPPVLQLATPLNITVPLLSTFSEPGYSAIDAISGNVTNGVKIDRSAYDSTKVGSYTIYYIAEDGFGNRDTQTRVVNVIDVTAPIITLNGANPFEVEVYTSFNDPGVSVSDNYDPIIIASLTSNVNINALGTYNILYTAIDSSGNISSVSREVIVSDKTAPTLNVAGPDTLVVEVFGSLVLPANSANDNYDLNPQVLITGSYDLTTLGIYSVNFVAEDASGNQSTSISKVIKVVDTEIPLITLNGMYLTNIQRWVPFNDPGVTITDNYDNNLTAVEGGNFVNTNELGLYYITYDVVDGSGNVALQVTRAINVVDNITSVNDVDEVQFSMYPNPAVNQVTLDFGQEIDADVQLTVRNSLGQEILSSTLKPITGMSTVDVSNWTPGVYFVQVVTEGKTTIRRLIINK